MKLPEDKKERQKILMLIGIGVAAVAYGIWSFVFAPKLAERSSSEAAVAELQTKMEDAQEEIRRAPLVERDLRAAYSNIIELSERHMLHPRLGSSYILPAREIINRHARTLNIEGVVVEEVGLIAMPRPKEAAKPKPKKGEEQETQATDKPATPESPSTPPPTIQAYAARITATCSYEDLRRWCEAMEKENPMLAICNIMITAQPEDPLKHLVTFEALWPTWIDPDQRERLIDDAELLVVAEAEK